ncbi:sulfotransferase domain-containing protein [Fodinibius sediminis]|uniref:Sulfotransferase domain-containing protein n=1 Tax=Fodinibius sediminis TaxID=1214077 RepID=A0A521D8U9_9BACT|nr:sulfotransferase domain-containing protein [Fodinibius sediminis]SMO68129.1 Sulfotransferase domain-containing protein [Fodinibius sediminis]
MLPDFIIIGAMKSGTSSLFHYLQLHPEVGMSAIKEVDFFIAENNYGKGVDWYRSQFTGNFSKYGEASPNYSKAHYFAGVPQRMHDLLPDVKLIYLVRDPIERIISHYTHNYSEGREHRTIEEALETLSDNHYVMCSKYFWQLNHFMEYYQGAQILVMPSRELKYERHSALQRVFAFVGVDEMFYDPAYEEQKHQSSQKRRKGRLSRLVLESPLIKTLKYYIPDAIKDPIKKATRPEITKPTLRPELRDKLREYLQPDVEKLQAFTGYSFSSWDI